MELEFTIEPFVEGRPGPHVRAAVGAAEAAGVAVEFGPFGSMCRVATEELPGLVASIVSAAFSNGATHVSMHMGVDGPPASEEPQ